MKNLQIAKRFEELLGADVENGPYEFALLFKADGWLDRMRSKNRFKLLRAVDAKLRTILHEGERVYFATSGTTANFAEQYFAGAAVTQALNRRALLFTTERVILIQIDSKKRPRELVSQIAYTAINEVKATWNGYCQLTLRDKSKLKFIGVPKADRKHLSAFLADIVKTAATAAVPGNAAAVEHLCPHCYKPVPGHPEACPHCQGRFKLARAAMLRSLIFPGLGDLYLGHKLFAAIEMIGAAFMWFALVGGALAGTVEADGTVRAANAGDFITAFIALAILHGLDAVMTRHFALKGHHPA